ncbi:MAG: DNA alkylation repair protein, partial [Clostridiales bacterium]|nr:DNA alkylation repair protein [Clostridiales bacterium]
MTDDINEIREYLRSNQDKGYRELQIRTIPSIGPERIIGVRTPVLRAYAKGLSAGYLDMLPH